MSVASGGGAGGFDPSKSKASSDKLAAWIAETPLPDELTRIPGVGPATVAALATVGVDSCAQLVGHFLMFKRTGISMRELCDSFVFWLKESGVEANRHSICHAIAEKACVWLGAPFNAEELRDD